MSSFLEKKIFFVRFAQKRGLFFSHKDKESGLYLEPIFAKIKEDIVLIFTTYVHYERKD